MRFTSQKTNLQRFLSLLNKLLWMTGIAVLGYFAEIHQGEGLVQDVWSAAKTASPFAAMFTILAWIDERRERREAQQQCMDRTIDFVEAVNLAHSSLEKAIMALSARQRQTQSRK